MAEGTGGQNAGLSTTRSQGERFGRDGTVDDLRDKTKPRSESGALVRVIEKWQAPGHPTEQRTLDGDPDLPGAAAARSRHHRVAGLAAEGLAELIEVLHGALDAPLTGGVRVGLGLVDGGLLRLRAAPDLREGDEEALVWRVAVALAVDVAGLGLRALFLQGVLKGLEGDADAGVIGGVLTERQMAVEVLTRSHLKAVVLLGIALAAILELGEVIGCEPHADVALRVVLCALVVEAVGHLVADDDADAAEVDGRILGDVIERRLQDPGGEVDVVLRRLVVGVDGRRRHAPFHRG